MFSLRNIYSRISTQRFFNVSPFNTRNASTMGKLTLYGDEASPPVRFVMMTASILNIDYTFHKIDLFKEEHRTHFYRQINPIQKVPALAVDEEVICDSHAIALYLCHRTQNQDLYPSDPLEKAKVDQMLFFNATILFPIDSFIFTEYFAGNKALNQEKVKEWNYFLKYLDNHLVRTTWLAGDKMRLCDICCAATVSSLGLLVPGLENFPAVNKWMERLQEISCFKINNYGLKRLNSFVKLRYSS